MVSCGGSKDKRPARGEDFLQKRKFQADEIYLEQKEAALVAQRIRSALDLNDRDAAALLLGARVKQQRGAHRGWA